MMASGSRRSKFSNFVSHLLTVVDNSVADQFSHTSSLADSTLESKLMVQL